VRLPQLAPMRAIVCDEEDLSVDFHEVGGVGAAWPWVNIGYHDGPLFRAVGLPEFGTILAVVGSEVDRAANEGGGASDIRACRAAINVLDQHSGQKCPVFQSLNNGAGAPGRRLAAGGCALRRAQRTEGDSHEQSLLELRRAAIRRP